MNKQLRKALVELAGAVQGLMEDGEVTRQASEAASTASFLFNRDVNGAVSDEIAEEAIAQFANTRELSAILNHPMSDSTKALIKEIKQ